MNKVRQKRCAVYCRVSTDERLGQEYNSIDAQKESGHAFIASQRSEGWVSVADDYDDPGFSGGNTDRPGLKRLMADIEAGLIDIVVVYKIDRLTRSLLDFSSIVEVFDRMNVSFVSVTQQFNTTTSMGRLMLNVLLSFAQFEREVTSERIRDKFAASKRKGMWMGGVPPLGYDVKNRRLVVNEEEAVLVRKIYKMVTDLGSVMDVADQLNAQGYTTKSWTTKRGIYKPGTPFTAAVVKKLVRRRTSLGEISYYDEWHPGEHKAIVDQVLWDKAQQALDVDKRERSYRTLVRRQQSQSLLRGLLYAPDGQTMYHNYAQKNGVEYRYYVSQSRVKFGSIDHYKLRLPAADVERVVIEQVRTVLTSPEALQAIVFKTQQEGLDIQEDTVVMAMGNLDAVWDELFLTERQRLISLMIERVDLVDNPQGQGIRITWRELGWRELIEEFAPNTIGHEMLELES